MCQNCVDNGFLKQSTFDKIEAFLEKYPSAEWGPAHIVLSDDNLEDGHIKWCIGLAKASLSRDRNDLPNPDEDESMMNELDWYSDCTLGEVHHTIAFLEELLTIPEEER